MTKSSAAIKSLLMMILGLLGGATAAQAATYEVTNINDSGAGSLRQAIDDANNSSEDDTINISVTGAITLTSGQLTVANNGALIVNAPGGNLLTVSGNNASRVFIISGANATISGITVTGGKVSGNSGTAFRT